MQHIVTANSIQRTSWSHDKQPNNVAKAPWQFPMKTDLKIDPNISSCAGPYLHHRTPTRTPLRCRYTHCICHLPHHLCLNSAGCLISQVAIVHLKYQPWPRICPAHNASEKSNLKPFKSNASSLTPTTAHTSCLQDTFQ